MAASRSKHEMRHENIRNLDKFSLWGLADVYEHEHRGWPVKIAAEVAFALAVAVKREADRMGDGFKDKKEEYTATARRYAQECIMHAKRLSSEALSDVGTNYTSLVGVGMPNYFYMEYITDKKFFPAFASLLE